MGYEVVEPSANRAAPVDAKRNDHSIVIRELDMMPNVPISFINKRLIFRGNARTELAPGDAAVSSQ